MTLPIITGTGLPSNLASDEAGGIHTPHHKVTALPGTAQNDIADLNAQGLAMATAIGALQTTLGNVAAAQAAPGAIYGNKTTVTTPGVRVVLGASQVLTEGVELRGLDLNAGLIYPGNATVSATAGGTRLAAKEKTFIRCNNVNLVYLDAATGGEGVTWIGW